MSIKKYQVDPRTGTVVKSNKKPSAPLPEPSIQIDFSQANTLELILKELQKITALIEKTQELGKPAANYTLVPPKVLEEVGFAIDEDILDVGILDSEELKKGKDSSSVGNASTDLDKSISKSQSKLKALKKKE